MGQNRQKWRLMVFFFHLQDLDKKIPIQYNWAFFLPLFELSAGCSWQEPWGVQPAFFPQSVPFSGQLAEPLPGPPRYFSIPGERRCDHLELHQIIPIPVSTFQCCSSGKQQPVAASKLHSEFLLSLVRLHAVGFMDVLPTKGPQIKH